MDLRALDAHCPVTLGIGKGARMGRGFFCVKLINAPINRDENCRPKERKKVKTAERIE